jgi:hypothetical protein
MLGRTIAVALCLCAFSVAAAAQSPYAGLQTRPVKALSEAQIADLKAGRGMGLALAAELNGYPGPLHVLELSGRLDLSGEQRARIAALFEWMKAEAIPIGARLIEQETMLDREFADRTITPASLRDTLVSIGETQAALREAHLKYHLATAAIMATPPHRSTAAITGGRGPHPASLCSATLSRLRERVAEQSEAG